MNPNYYTGILLGLLATFLTAVSGAPCGRVEIDPRIAICCNGLVFIRSGFRPSCCGNTGYDSQHFMCCENTIVRRAGMMPKCCGRRGYDRLSDVCVDGYLNKRTQLGQTCCQTDQGWKCCRKGESCCVASGSGSVEVPGFRQPCCNINSIEPKAECCSNTMEKYGVLPSCCGSDRLRPICCKKRDGSIQCCSATIGYCCGVTEQPVSPWNPYTNRRGGQGSSREPARRPQYPDPGRLDPRRPNNRHHVPSVYPTRRSSYPDRGYVPSVHPTRRSRYPDGRVHIPSVYPTRRSNYPDRGHIPSVHPTRRYLYPDVRVHTPSVHPTRRSHYPDGRVHIPSVHPTRRTDSIQNPRQHIPSVHPTRRSRYPDRAHVPSVYPTRRSRYPDDRRHIPTVYPTRRPDPRQHVPYVHPTRRSRYPDRAHVPSVYPTRRSRYPDDRRHIPTVYPTRRPDPRQHVPYVHPTRRSQYPDRAHVPQVYPTRRSRYPDDRRHIPSVNPTRRSVYPDRDHIPLVFPTRTYPRINIPDVYPTRRSPQQHIPTVYPTRRFDIRIIPSVHPTRRPDPRRNIPSVHPTRRAPYPYNRLLIPTIAPTRWSREDQRRRPGYPGYDPRRPGYSDPRLGQTDDERPGQTDRDTRLEPAPRTNYRRRADIDPRIDNRRLGSDKDEDKSIDSDEDESTESDEDDVEGVTDEVDLPSSGEVDNIAQPTIRAFTPYSLVTFRPNYVYPTPFVQPGHPPTTGIKNINCCSSRFASHSCCSILDQRPSCCSKGGKRPSCCFETHLWSKCCQDTDIDKTYKAIVITDPVRRSHPIPKSDNRVQLPEGGHIGHVPRGQQLPTQINTTSRDSKKYKKYVITTVISRTRSPSYKNFYEQSSNYQGSSTGNKNTNRNLQGKNSKSCCDAKSRAYCCFNRGYNAECCDPQLLADQPVALLPDDENELDTASDTCCDSVVAMPSCCHKIYRKSGKIAKCCPSSLADSGRSYQVKGDSTPLATPILTSHKPRDGIKHHGRHYHRHGSRRRQASISSKKE